MKKIILTTIILGLVSLGWGQSQVKNGVRHASKNNVNHIKNSLDSDLNTTKTLACIDTIRYPQVKEQILGTSNFYIFDLWANDNESMSQAFLLSGSTIGISGVEFFGRNSPNGGLTVTVRASIFNIDGSNNPTTEVAFANVILSDTNFNYRQVNFTTPINVSGNYAVVIRPTNVGGIVDLYVNDVAIGQQYDENLSRARSTWYTSSNGNWVTMPTYTISGFTGGPYDFEMLVAPKISYTINTDFTTSPNPSCIGTPVVFSNTTEPSTVINSRFYNYQKFRTFFQSIPDSSYAYNMGGGVPLIWSENTTYTYTTAANHTPVLNTLGGFWNSCLDNNTKTVTVNPLPVVQANASSLSVCNGDEITLFGSGATSYIWENGVINGVAFSPTITDTYTVTGTDANNCQNSDQVTVTLNTVDATILTIGGAIASLNSNASYQWVDCDNNNQPISGATNQSFVPTITGNYAVVVTENGCNEMSICESIDLSGINNINSNNIISVYPNPTEDFFSISTSNDLTGAILKIVSVTGQILIQKTVVSDNTHTFDLSNFASGLYFVEIYQSGSLNTIKVIKN
jgi:hypothetical protein